jgi:prepilin-type processing-associated H-X9-DG protein
MMYVQDYDETFPCIRFHGDSSSKGARTYVWRNAIAPYLRSIDVFACPSNPYSRAVAGIPGNDVVPPPSGGNAEGWEVEPGQRMPISYAMNSCAATWYPADSKEGQSSPPLRMAQLARPGDTILVMESLAPWPDSDAHQLWEQCFSIFAHPTGKVGNFIFHDGHVKAKRWLSTLYPLTENNWEILPNPDPNNRTIKGPPGCQWSAPAGPDAKEFQTKECQAYQ